MPIAKDGSKKDKGWAYGYSSKKKGGFPNMFAIPSTLTTQVKNYVSVSNGLSELGFSLGGNWDYDHGSFDCALDEANKVWLRLPFEVTTGQLDEGNQENNADIQFGQPYVLKHVYNEGLDQEAQPRAMGALMDQFSDPIDPDDEIESHWIDKARQKLNSVESIFQR